MWRYRYEHHYRAADGHAVLRDSLQFLLGAQADFTVVGAAGNGRDAIQQVAQPRPDVAILDIAMPEMNGIEAARQIRQACPSTQVIILSMHRTPEHISQALQAGARGYLVKESASDEVIEAVRAVHVGKRYMSQGLSDVAIVYYVGLHRDDAVRSRLDSLTTREREILQLLAEGRSSPEIADLLSLSPRTIDSCRSRIMQKLDIHHLPG